MCGLAGAITPQPLPPERVRETLKLLHHRGPDAQGEATFPLPGGFLRLLHTRLSIIDLSDAANQPFTRDGFTLVFNGELYNYRELRSELENLGHRFTTQSDTEVLLCWLKSHGMAALDRCEGMWAFALYEHATHTLTLCRDRFGEKPLFLWENTTGFYFASEVKGLFALRGQKAPVNLNHLYRLLVNGYKALYKTTETFFEGVRELPPGCRLTLAPGESPVQERYWSPQIGENADMTFDQAVAGARRALERSLALRLRSDVPIAFCLSGGIDSNALTALASKVFKTDVHGFTIVNTDTRYEEQDMVAAAVAHLGLRHTNVPVNTQGFLAGLRRLVQQHDAPVYTITWYAHWLLMQTVREQGYKVVMSGTGADELFSGYYDHHNFYLASVAGDKPLYEASLQHWRQQVAPWVRNPFLQDPEVFVKNPDLRGHIYLDAADFAAFLKTPWREDFTEQPYHPVPLRRRMFNELFHESVPPILHLDDHNAMSCSLENRSPYLDRELFDFCQSIPTRLLVQQGRAKAVLREAVRDVACPAVLDNPRKVGFNAPIFSFLNPHDPQVRAEVLGDSPVFDHLRREKIETLLDEAHLPNSQSKFFFSFLNAKYFLEAFS